MAAGIVLMAAVAAVPYKTSAGTLDLDKAGRKYQASGVREVSTQAELEQALYARESLNIHLKKNITVSRLLRVRGRKKLQGGTYRIRRKTGAGACYRGTLFWMQGESLILNEVTINGGGRSKGADGNVNGRLLETVSGTVVLGKGTKLSTNYNLTSLTDGGGGITIHSGGTVVMKDQSAIYDNLSVTGGSGIRIENGGVFVMEGGTIRDNAVIGQRAETGFDGRGGAIHNRGRVWIRGGTISGNVARGYMEDGDKHGGFGGAVYNMGDLNISGGVIEKNQAAFAGGAIYTNAHSSVIVNSGVMKKNQSPGQRGGGIYLSGAAKVTVKGGRLCDNEAADGSQIFLSSTSTGSLCIESGVLAGEGAAVYNNGSRVSVSGGMIGGTRCGIYHAGGEVFVSGNAHINRIYLRSGSQVNVDRKLNTDGVCELWPQEYQEGKRLVTITSGEPEKKIQKAFSLKKKKRFFLETGDKALLIGREKYKIQFLSNGGMGVMGEQSVYMDEKMQLPKCSFWRDGYGFVGWSDTPVRIHDKKDIRYAEKEMVCNLGTNGSTVVLYALWVKRPTISSQYSHLIFYEGEQVSSDILFKGMSVQDECDGDISRKLVIDKIMLPGGDIWTGTSTALPTGEADLGSGKIIYQVSNSFGVSSIFVQSYEVTANESPRILTADRYYFTGEYNGETMEAEQDAILAKMLLRDDTETVEQLKWGWRVSWGGLNLDKPGCYKVIVTVKDQYGHRYYMEDGEEKQYGIGKSASREFKVHVVERVNPISQNEEQGYVRFISKDTIDTLLPDSCWRFGEFRDRLEKTFQKDQEEYEEIWVISGKDKQKIKAFVRKCDNPFSKETNQLFLKQFRSLKRE